jgi:hypothetical protein
MDVTPGALEFSGQCVRRRQKTEQALCLNKIAVDAQFFPQFFAES